MPQVWACHPLLSPFRFSSTASWARHGYDCVERSKKSTTPQRRCPSQQLRSISRSAAGHGDGGNSTGPWLGDIKRLQNDCSWEIGYKMTKLLPFFKSHLESVVKCVQRCSKPYLHITSAFQNEWPWNAQIFTLDSLEIPLDLFCVPGWQHSMVVQFDITCLGRETWVAGVHFRLRAVLLGRTVTYIYIYYIYIYI